MKKLEFINELGAQLHSMPAEEVRPLLDYYMEIVADRMEDGMTEEEAVASLGPHPRTGGKDSGRAAPGGTGTDFHPRSPSGACFPGKAPLDSQQHCPGPSCSVLCG